MQDINSSLHQQISYEAALQSFVLLKNDGHALPIKQGASVAVPGLSVLGNILRFHVGLNHVWIREDSLPEPNIHTTFSFAN